MRNPIKKLTLVSLIFSSLFISMSSYKVSFAKETKEELIPDGFRKAIMQITPDYFFSDPIEPYERFKKANLPFEGIDKAYKAREHYKELTDAVCKPMAMEMEAILAKKIEGQESIFGFTKELTKIMREAGAYSLPLRLERADIHATFFDLAWVPNMPDEVALSKFEQYNKEIGSGGLVHSSGKGEFALKGAPWAMSTDMARVYHDMLDKLKYKLGKYEHSYDFTQTYLFVLQQDPKNINSDRVYVYVDIPYRVEGNEFGHVNVLTKSILVGYSPYRPEKVRCFVASKSGLGAASSSLNEESKKKLGAKAPERFLSILDILPPPTLPANPHNTDSNASYDIQASEVTQPYLRCWLGSFNIIEGKSDGCTSSGYAEEYANIIRSDMCGGEKVSKIDRQFEFPYHYNRGPRNDVVVYRAGYNNLYVYKKSCDDYKTNVSLWGR